MFNNLFRTEKAANKNVNLLLKDTNSLSAGNKPPNKPNNSVSVGGEFPENQNIVFCLKPPEDKKNKEIKTYKKKINFYLL